MTLDTFLSYYFFLGGLRYLFLAVEAMGDKMNGPGNTVVKIILAASNFTILYFVWNRS